MAAEGEATEHEEPQRQEFGGTEGWDDPGGEPGDLSSLSAQTEWLNQQPMVRLTGAILCPWSVFARSLHDPGEFALLGCPRARPIIPHASAAAAERSSLWASCRTLARHAPAVRLCAVRFPFLHTL